MNLLKKIWDEDKFKKLLVTYDKSKHAPSKDEDITANSQTKDKENKAFNSFLRAGGIKSATDFVNFLQDFRVPEGFCFLFRYTTETNL